MKSVFSLTLLSLVAVLFGALLFPIASPEFAIEFDEAAIARKNAFLDDIRDESSHDPNRPNILILLADDLGKFDVSLFGGTRLETPNIDSLGERGVAFTEAYCTSPTCSPSRAAMLTGRYQQRFGYETQIMNQYPRNVLEWLGARYIVDLGNWQPVDLMRFPGQRDIERQGVPPSEILLSELLQADGYRTGLLGKWHLGAHENFRPRERGFDYVFGFYEAFSLHAPIGTPGIVEHRLNDFDDEHQWRQQRTGPSALRRNGDIVEDDGYLSFTLADEATRFIEASGDDPFALLVAFNAPHQPFQAPQEYYDRFPEIQDHGLRVFVSMVAALDDAIGQIVDKVDNLGLAEDTIIWFASDNGAPAYTGVVDNAPLKGGKFNYFEGGINIPMTLTWESTIAPGQTIDEPVSLMDIFTTSAVAAGSALPGDRPLDGIDLLPLASGTKSTPRDALYWRTHYASGIRQGDWKLLTDSELGRDLLYDLNADKFETTDLDTAQPAIVQQLNERLEQWESELAPPLCRDSWTTSSTSTAPSSSYQSSRSSPRGSPARSCASMLP